MAEHSLYPPIEPLSHGWLDLGDGHDIYFEQCGHPDGIPILVVHGGPGAGCMPIHRRYFDPGLYRIILFDQRGCGRSRPAAETAGNSLVNLIADMEALRRHLGITNWALFGGSWGATLSLAYAEAHPDHVLGLVLRGIFLMQPYEIDWFMHGMGKTYPEAAEKFLSYLPEDERHDPLTAYYERLKNPDPAIHMPAAHAWSRYEEACAHFRPDLPQHGGWPFCEGESDATSLALARLEAHYFIHETLSPPDRLLREAHKLEHIPGHIIQGRHDTVCPPETAYALARAWPQAEFEIIENAAHAASDPAMARALVAATDRMAKTLKDRMRQETALAQ